MTDRRYLSDAAKAEIIERFAGRCGECGFPFYRHDGIEWDHALPLWLAGTNDDGNWQPLHVECHKIKTKREAAARAKGNRLLGRTKQGRKQKIPSRPFWRPKMKRLKMGERRER